MDVTTYALSRKYTDNSILGISGVLAGKNCTISSIDHADGKSTITFKWTADDGTIRTRAMVVEDGLQGVSIVGAEVTAQGHLILTLSDDTALDCGVITGDAQLQEPLTATVEIGTVTNGKTYAKGTKLEQIIRDMLIKYTPPAVTLTTTPATKLYDIVTDSISTILLKAAVTKKTNNVTKVAFYIGDTLLNEVTSGVASGGNFQYQYTPATAIRSNVTFKATATDGKQTTTSNYVIKFVGQSYYGICDANVSEPDETIIKSGSKTLKDTKAYVYNNIVTPYGKVFYAYPKEFGTLSSVRDNINNINYWESFARTEVTIDGVPCYCYTQIDPSAAEGVQITFG